jgi:hypothetical protein
LATAEGAFLCELFLSLTHQHRDQIVARTAASLW